MEQDGDFSIKFGDSKLKEIFCKMAADQPKINAELQRKDALLSAVNILRPGEIYEIRKRRKSLAQALTREPTGRLRSNPRKKRLDDMISPVKRSRKDWSLHGTSHNTNAVKAREKMKREGATRSVVNKSGVMPGRRQRSPHKQPHMLMPVVLDTTPTTRPKRSASLRSYIDWKFCYERVSESKKLADATSRKRCRRLPTTNIEANPRTSPQPLNAPIALAAYRSSNILSKGDSIQPECQGRDAEKIGCLVSEGCSSCATPKNHEKHLPCKGDAVESTAMTLHVSLRFLD